MLSICTSDTVGSRPLAGGRPGAWNFARLPTNVRLDVHVPPKEKEWLIPVQ